LCNNFKVFVQGENAIVQLAPTHSEWDLAIRNDSGNNSGNDPENLVALAPKWAH
jgi:hypothetical protein